jgi:rare lipoprotein A
VAALALLAGACARATAVPPPRPGPAPLGWEETGIASWYGHPYHGRHAASGEIYDMHQMTAAHRTLPFGTWLLVENLDNRRTAEVRVTDRGPFKDQRILDLSYAAARLLDAIGPGLIPVRLRVISGPARGVAAPAAAGARPAGTSAPAPAPLPRATGPGTSGGAPPAAGPGPAAPAAAFTVQLGAFAEEARAVAFREGLARGGITAAVQRAETVRGLFYRVRVGPFASRDAALEEARRLAGQGHAVLVTEE